MKLHLGCGGSIFNGWDNLDINNKCGAIKTDLTKKLPYKDNTVDFIYSQHFIEHITEAQGIFLLTECFRVLKKDGVARIVTPDLDLYVDAFLNWKNYSKDRPEILSPQQFLNYAMIDEALKFGHRFIYTKNDLRDKAFNIGFSKVEDKTYLESDYIDLKNREYHGRHILQLQIELVK